MHIVLVIFYTAAIFMAMMVNLAVKPKAGARITGILIVAAAVMGFLLYGYGYACTFENTPLAVLRATSSVWFMFVGRNDFSAISAAPLMHEPAVQMVFWGTHLCAIYAFASATFITIGSGAVRFMRMVKAGFSDLDVLYGVNDASVSFAAALAGTGRRRAILLIDDRAALGPYETDINGFGGLILTDSAAGKAAPSFIRAFRIRKGKRRYRFFALDEMPLDNIRFAEDLKEALEKAGVLPQQTSLVIAADESLTGENFISQNGAYGFGEVFVFPPGEMTARALVRAFPPAGTLHYDTDGRATEDFDALLIGFGRTSQCVLKYLIMHGQAEGAGFHVMVCDRQLREISGSFFHENEKLLKEYDIEFMEKDARSVELYDYIAQHLPTLKYVVISTGDPRLDQEILLSIEKTVRSAGSDAAVLCCSRKGIFYVDRKTMQWESVSPMTPENLCDEKMDAQAIALNQAYHAQNGKTDTENWACAGYFDRTSCRAAADFLTGYLRAVLRAVPRAAGETGLPLGDKGAELSLGEGGAGLPLGAGGAGLSEKQWENLGRTEHRRWIAFHHVMGYSRMPEDIWEERAKLLKSGRTDISVGKDPARRLHACMIPWEELPALEAKEEKITGKRKDYRAMDMENVRIVLSFPEFTEFPGVTEFPGATESTESAEDRS